MFKLIKKTELFEFEKPFAEPEMYKHYTSQKYYIERFTYEDGKIIWFGEATNWLKQLDGTWTVLITNQNAKPLEKYLPDVVYGEDRNVFIPCEIPIYEKIISNIPLKFKEAYLVGQIKIEDIDNYIDAWHDSDSKLTINEYLGLTWKEYEQYVKNDPEFLQIKNLDK